MTVDEGPLSLIVPTLDKLYLQLEHCEYILQIWDKSLLLI